MSVGNAGKAHAEEEFRDKAAIWQLGLPKPKPKAAEAPAERPSLVGVSEALANMRKAIGSVA